MRKRIIPEGIFLAFENSGNSRLHFSSGRWMASATPLAGWLVLELDSDATDFFHEGRLVEAEPWPIFVAPDPAHPGLPVPEALCIDPGHPSWVRRVGYGIRPGSVQGDIKTTSVARVDMKP